MVIGVTRKIFGSGFKEFLRELRALRAKRLSTSHENREAETAQIMSGGDKSLSGAISGLP
jgi:hypothetical protein